MRYLSELVTIVTIAVGLPVFGVCAIVIIALLRGYSLKTKELRYKEQQLKAEERLKTEELNAQILRMDDGISAAQIVSLADEVRRLREEVAQLKQDLNNRITG